MLTVKFNYPDEFLEELRKDLPADGIVRKTAVYRSSNFPKLKHVSVLATYLNARGQIVNLEHYCGDVWVGDKDSTKVHDKVKEVLESIEKCCRELNLEIRAGMLQETEVKS